MADQQRLYRMRAPSGEEQDVPKDDIDYYRRKGAVLLGPSGDRPAAASPIYDAATSQNLTGTGLEAGARKVLGNVGQFQADAGLGAISGLANMGYAGGDLIRRGLGMERIVDKPEVMAAREAPNSLGGMTGRMAMDALAFSRTLGAAGRGATALGYGGKGGQLAAEMTTGAGMGGLQTDFDPHAMVAGAAFPAVMAARGALPTGALGRTGKIAADAALGGGTGYLLSGGDPNMTMAGAIGLPAVTGGRALGSTALQAAGRIAEGASEGGVGGAVAGLLRKAAPGSPWRMITQAVKPKNSQVNFEQNLPNIAPMVKHVAETAGLPLASLDDVLAATKATKQAVRAQFDDAIGDTSRMVDLTPLANLQRTAIPSILEHENPGAYAAAVRRAEAYRGLKVPLEKAEDFLRQTNAQLEAYYQKFPGAQRKALASKPVVAMREAKAKALRNVLYGDNPNLPQPARILNRRYGQLAEFEETLLRRKNVADRQQPESLSEQIGKVRAVGQMARGVYRGLHGDPFAVADIVGAKAGSEAATFLKEQQTTDALLRRAFAQIPGPGPRRPVAGAIGPGARPMGPAPDTSGPIPSGGPATYPEPVSRPGQRALPPGTPATGTTVLEGEVVGQPDPSYARGVPTTPAENVPRPGQRQLPASTTASRQTELGMPDQSYVRSIPADIEGGTPYADFERAFKEAMEAEGGSPTPRRSGFGSTAMAIGGPAASAAVPDDPESQWDDYARLALNVGGAAGAIGMASRMFDPKLKAELDHQQVLAKAKQKADYLKRGGKEDDFKVHDSGVETHIRNYLRKYTGGNSREADRLINAYETIPLPVHKGVDFDERKVLGEVLDYDEPGTAGTTTDRAARGTRLSDWSKKRMDVAYDEGVERAKTEGWGDPRYLYHLTNGDPKAAVRLARLFGAFSPGQKTDANSLQGVEAFIRSAMGETPEQILGKKVPDPGRPGKEMRVGGSMSFKHVRPSTVEQNLERAILDGRIFQEKVEALAAAEVGITDKIPIDMWLLRALGAESDVTPGSSFYRLISEAVTKEAVKRGESPFSYMAKVWMGVQKIAGAETPSFQASVSKTRLPGPITNRAVQESFVANPKFHEAAIRNKSMSDVGEVFPLADNPQMSYEAFLPELHQAFKAGTTRDVLGKQTIVQNPKPVTLADMRLTAQAEALADDLATQKRTTRGPGKLMLLPDGTTQWFPFRGFVEKSGKPRAYKTPKGAALVKEYKPKAKGKAD